MRSLLEVFLLLLLSAVVALGAYLVAPERIDLNADRLEISLESALLLDDVLWVDARAREAFEEGTWGEAIALSEDDWDLGFVGLLEVWYPERPIVVFCSSQACTRSKDVAARLREDLATEDVFALAGGWERLMEYEEANR